MQPPLDLLQEPLPCVLVDVIEAISGKPQRADIGRKKPADAAHQELPVGTADIKIVEPPGRPKGGHDAKPDDVGKPWNGAWTINVEGNARQPHAIKIAF